MVRFKNKTINNKFIKAKRKSIFFFSLVALPTIAVVTTTSCSSNSNLSNLSLSQLVNLYYGDVKITPSEFASKLPATSEHWPVSNIDEIYFVGFPEPQQGIDVNCIEVSNYDPNRGEMTIVIRYSKGKEYIDKEYRIEGFAIEKKSFDEIVDEIYGDVSIYLTPKGEELTASPDIWNPSMITPQYFYGLPTKQDGISVLVESIETNEKKCYIDIYYKYSKNDDSTTRVYRVTGFKEVEPLLGIIHEIYGNIEITPTEEAKKLTAIEENWPISNINSKYFNGLPESKNGIIATVKSVSFEPNEGIIWIQYLYTKGSQSVEQTYRVTGLKKIN